MIIIIIIIIIAFTESSLCDGYCSNHFVLCCFNYHNNLRKQMPILQTIALRLRHVQQIAQGLTISQWQRIQTRSYWAVGLPTAPEGGTRTAQITYRLSRPLPLPLCSAKPNALQGRGCSFDLLRSWLLGPQAVPSPPYPVLSPGRVVLA